MSYRQILKRLEALPPSEREFAAGSYVFKLVNGKPRCGCAIGKALSQRDRLRLAREEKKAQNEEDWREPANQSGVPALAEFLGLSIPKMPWESSEPFICGLTFAEAYKTQGKNDDKLDGKNDKRSRLRRYRDIMKWLREMVRDEKERPVM